MTEPRFQADGESVTVTLEPEERKVLLGVLDLLANVGEVADDPAASRLSVPVYLDDPEANDEWWRLMGDELESSRNSDRALYRKVMTEDGPLILDGDEAGALLRVLNEGRLAFAARLGLDVEDDHDRLPLPQMMALDFLGWVLEELTVELSTTL